MVRSPAHSSAACRSAFSERRRARWSSCTGARRINQGGPERSVVCTAFPPRRARAQGDAADLHDASERRFDSPAPLIKCAGHSAPLPNVGSLSRSKQDSTGVERGDLDWLDTVGRAELIHLQLTAI